MLGVVPILVLQERAGVDTLSHLLFDVISLLFRSQVGLWRIL